MKPVLIDTGPIVALLDSNDTFHGRCVDVIGAITAPLVTCEAVIAESCYLLRRMKGAPEAVLENLAAGVFQIPLPLGSYARNVSRILTKYRRREVDLADACLVHLAGELAIGEILTLDRDFEVYRWSGKNAFRLLIPMS